MFHIKGARWRLVPYVILEGRSPDRIQTSIKKDRSDAALSCIFTRQKTCVARDHTGWLFGGGILYVYAIWRKP